MVKFVFVLRLMFVLGLWGVLIFGMGCTSGDQPSTGVTKYSMEGKAKLWGRVCIRCHSLRRPEGFSDANWEIVVFHMQAHAYLHPEEAKQILEFLKASN